MKRIYLLAFAAGILSITSCSESEVSEVVDNTPKKMTFTVGTSASETRASVRTLESQNPAVDWDETDQLYVWGLGNTEPALFSFSQYGNYHNYAAFIGSIIPADKYYLMYPNISGTTMVYDGEVGHITTTIPAVQKATINSFDPAAAVCTGAGKANFAFAVCGKQIGDIIALVVIIKHHAAVIFLGNVENVRVQHLLRAECAFLAEKPDLNTAAAKHSSYFLRSVAVFVFDFEIVFAVFAGADVDVHFLAVEPGFQRGLNAAHIRGVNAHRGNGENDHHSRNGKDTFGFECSDIVLHRLNLPLFRFRSEDPEGFLVSFFIRHRSSPPSVFL